MMMSLMRNDGMVMMMMMMQGLTAKQWAEKGTAKGHFGGVVLSPSYRHVRLCLYLYLYLYLYLQLVLFLLQEYPNTIYSMMV